MLYQLSYDPLISPNLPHPTGCSMCIGRVRPLKANEVRVYVVRSRASNRKCPHGSPLLKIHWWGARIRTDVLPLFSP